MVHGEFSFQRAALICRNDLDRSVSDGCGETSLKGSLGRLPNNDRVDLGGEDRAALEKRVGERQHDLHFR